MVRAVVMKTLAARLTWQQLSINECRSDSMGNRVPSAKGHSIRFDNRNIISVRHRHERRELNVVFNSLA